MRKILAIVLVLILMVTALCFSSQNSGDSNSLSKIIAGRIVSVMELKGDDAQTLGSVNLIVRKLAHFTEYLLMGVLLAVALTNLLRRAWLAMVLAGAGGIVFAFLDEWVQRGSPGRGQSLFDVMVDGAGIVVGLAVFSIVMVGVGCSKSGMCSRNISGFRRKSTWSD